MPHRSSPVAVPKLQATGNTPAADSLVQKAGRGIRRWLATPYGWFWLIALTFGVIFTFHTPVFQIPDEPTHLYRSYQLASGALLSEQRPGGTGGEVPVSILTFKAYVDIQHNKEPHNPDPWGLKQVKLTPTETVFVRFENTAVYNPLVYAPQVVAIWISKALDATVLQTIYLARLFNLFTYITLAFFAIRLLPFGKWAGVAIALLPMHILLAGSLSSDPVSTGLLMLLVATVLRLRGLDRALSRPKLWLLVLLIAAVALSKIPFPLFLGLLLLVPAKVFGGRWRMAGFLGSNFVLAAVLCLGWFMVSQAVGSDHGPLEADDAQQLEFISQYPGEFAKVLFDTFVTKFNDGITQHYVISVGWLESWMPQWVNCLYAAFLGLTLLPMRPSTTAGRAAALNRWQKVWVALLLVIGAGLTATALYITWTSVGYPFVQGLQPRYFTPLLMLLIPLAGLRARKGLAAEGALSVWALRLVPVIFLIGGLMISLDWNYGIDTPITNSGAQNISE